MAVSTQQVSSSDFVKKLFKMLEDTSYQHVVRWSDMGDSFIVLDNNEFTKSVLPRHFKHSNFASFVRQLNKYDFHKVRNNEEGGINPYGEGAWEFKHRDFQVHNKELLENIKRKPPAAKKPPQSPAETSASQINNLQSQIESLTRYQDSLSNHLQGLSHQYQTVVSKMLNFQRTLSTQDNVMQNIIQYIVNPETNPGVSRDNTPFIPGDQAQKLISSYDEAAKASVDIMNDLSQLGASLAPNALVNQPPLPPPMQLPPHIQENTQYTTSTLSPTYSVKSEQVKSEYHTPTRETFASTATSPESNSNRPIQNPTSQPLEDPSDPSNFNTFDNFQFPEQPSGDSLNTGGLRVFTVGHFAPRQDEQDDSDNVSGLQHTPNNLPIVKDHDDKHHNGLRVRRQTFVPGWAVPPKILLVDDDAVYRNMSSKFLQVFGCEADVAVDGFSALDKVNVEKYDLILMDVVMPNLDGISATNMIRQFDMATPIISMTSNIHSSDIMHYFNSGMNDVLPKPFTKDSLLGMLEKHLLHMKQMQQMQQLGYPVPPLKSQQQQQQRVIELPPDEQPPLPQPQPTLPTTSLEDHLSLEDPNIFYENQNYAAMFGPNTTTPFQPSRSTATGKRRTASDRDPYEYLDSNQTVPRSNGGGTQAPGKRARYNTPPW